MSVPGSESLRVRIQVLGPLRVWRDGREVDPGPRQQRSVLAFLAARAGRQVTVPELIDLLWGEHPPASAVNAVHRYVGALRRVLDPAVKARSPGRWLVRDGAGYRLGVAPEHLDLAAFRRAASAARSDVRGGDEAAAFECYVEALRLWQGPPGGGFADTVAAQALFASLTGEYVAVAVDAARMARRLGRSERVVELLRQAASAAPFDESLCAELVFVLAAAGVGPLRAETLGEFRHIVSAGVRDAFYGSYRWLSSAAARLFRLLSLGSGSAVTVPDVAARVELPSPETHVLLEELHHVGLLQQENPGRYRWHRLVHAFAAELHATLDGEASSLKGLLYR